MINVGGSPSVWEYLFDILGGKNASPQIMRKEQFDDYGHLELEKLVTWARHFSKCSLFYLMQNDFWFLSPEEICNEDTKQPLRWSPIISWQRRVMVVYLAFLGQTTCIVMK